MPSPRRRVVRPIGAGLVYQRNGEKRRAYFVPREAVSLLSMGREVDFDPDRNRMGGPALGEMSFTQEYFRRLARECELPARFFALLDGDASEYAPEEAEQECCRKHSASATAPTSPDRRG